MIHQPQSLAYISNSKMFASFIKNFLIFLQTIQNTLRIAFAIIANLNFYYMRILLCTVYFNPDMCNFPCCYLILYCIFGKSLDQKRRCQNRSYILCHFHLAHNTVRKAKLLYPQIVFHAIHFFFQCVKGAAFHCVTQMISQISCHLLKKIIFAHHRKIMNYIQAINIKMRIRLKLHILKFCSLASDIFLININLQTLNLANHIIKRPVYHGKLFTFIPLIFTKPDIKLTFA